MQTQEFGLDAKPLARIGLGCMGMSWLYQESHRDDVESIRVIRSAIDSGVTLFDSANIYGNGHNERILGRAVGRRAGQVLVATKAGLVVDDERRRLLHRDARPTAVQNSVRASLKRLDLPVIDLLYLHRVDPEVPLEETWSAMAELVQDGLVRNLGLSEVTREQAERAHAQHPVAAIQSELSLWTRDPLGLIPDRTHPAAWHRSGDNLLDWCAQAGAVFVPFAPLGRGYLTATLPTTFEDSDFRSGNERFTPVARAANEKLLGTIRTIAKTHASSPAQVALAWVLAQGEHVVPIPGTKQLRYLRENLQAADLVLNEDEMRALDGLPAPSGARY